MDSIKMEQKSRRKTTDEKGYAKFENVTAGNYDLKEITPPKGYALDKTVYPVTINSSQTTRVDVKDYPQSDPVAILLGKIDRDTTQNMPQGSASLEGAEFTIKYYAVQSDKDPAETGKKPVRTWIMKTNEKGRCYLTKEYKVSGDEFYYDSNGNITLPLGTITIQETKAPKGYLLNEEIFVRQITSKGTGEMVETYNMPTIEEEVIRGDIQLVKYGETNDEPGDSGADIKKPLKDIKFHLTSKTTGDVYTIITDEQGVATTKQLGTSDRGNLPFDTYTVSEESPYPEYDIIAPFEVTVDEEGKTYTYILRNDTVDAPLSVQKVDKETGKIAGTLNGLATNETKFRDAFFDEISLYDPKGENVMLLGLSVLPEYRGQGIARALMEEYSRREQKNGRKQLILTCLQDKVEMYKKMNFRDEGISASTWGGEEWHDMTRKLND